MLAGGSRQQGGGEVGVLDGLHCGMFGCIDLRMCLEVDVYSLLEGLIEFVSVVEM